MPSPLGRVSNFDGRPHGGNKGVIPAKPIEFSGRSCKSLAEIGHGQRELVPQMGGHLAMSRQIENDFLSLMLGKN